MDKEELKAFVRNTLEGGYLTAYEAGLERALELIPTDVIPPKIEGNYKVEEAQWREDMAAEMYNRALAELRTRIQKELDISDDVIQTADDWLIHGKYTEKGDK